MKHEWLRRRDRSGYDCLRCDVMFDGEFDDDEHASAQGDCIDPHTCADLEAIGCVACHPVMAAGPRMVDSR